MSDVVLDASAVLAVVHDEPGAEMVRPHLPGAYLSAVNAAEVVAKMVDGGADPAEAGDKLFRLGTRVVAFEPGDIVPGAQLRKASRSVGLSLADRACLTLAQRLGLPALTADRMWSKLNLRVDIQQIR
ncbi:MAG: type II toxin-antitoxin system VapC family toxin [Kiloniellales bacterium]